MGTHIDMFSMKMSKRWQDRFGVIHALILCCCILVACGGKRVTDPALDDLDEVEDENELLSSYSNRIQVVPTMNSSFNDSNTVHCANIEYLWSALASNSDKSIRENALAKEFDQSTSWKNSMDLSKLILAFGKPSDVYESIVQQYDEKYEIDKSDLSPQGSTFWGYTAKVVSYRYAEPFDEQRLIFLGEEVSAFGFNSESMSTFVKEHFKDQFDVLYYNTDGEFVVKLKPANTTDEIILTMINKRGTFLEMFNATKKLIEKGASEEKLNRYIFNLNAEDELIIPVIRFNARREYTEVKGLEFSSKYGPVDVLEQDLNFSFDRKGVVLDATVQMADSTGMPQKPKLLHFNKPFYLYIKERKASHPYFNVWVSDVEILQKKKKAN